MFVCIYILAVIMLWNMGPHPHLDEFRWYENEDGYFDRILIVISYKLYDIIY